MHGGDLDDIVGVVHVKDVLGLAPERRRSTPLSGLVTPVAMVPESKPLDDLMLRAAGRGAATWRSCSTSTGAPPGSSRSRTWSRRSSATSPTSTTPSPPCPRCGPGAGRTSLSGRLHPDEVQEACGFEIPEGPYETLAGFVLDRLGRIPAVGDAFEHDGWQLAVPEMDTDRVAVVRWWRPAARGRRAGRRRAGPVSAPLLLVVGLLLVAANGFFVAVEFSLLAARRGRIEQWAEEGRIGASSALAGMQTLNLQLAACQLGITVMSLLLGWLDRAGDRWRPRAPVRRRRRCPERALRRPRRWRWP